MVYTLENITLGRFIDVYLGDIDKAVDGGDYSERVKQEAADKMCQEYMMIVGGKSVASLLVKRNNVLKIEMRDTCLSICKTLLDAGELDAAYDILGSMGYKVAKDKAAILKKIESVRASDSYQSERMRQSDGAHEKPSREHFIKERVAVMSHLKMHIDENVFKAKEYAYLVKQVSDEVDGMMKSLKK